jgi:hypothetical protein
VRVEGRSVRNTCLKVRLRKAHRLREGPTPTLKGNFHVLVVVSTIFQEKGSSCQEEHELQSGKREDVVGVWLDVLATLQSVMWRHGKGAPHQGGAQKSF